MKKIVLCCAIALSCLGINAMTVNWGGSTEAAGHPDGWINQGATYYLVFLGADYSGSYTATEVDKTTGLTNLGGTVMDSHVVTEDEYNNGQYSATLADSQSQSAANGYWQVVVIDGDVADAQVWQISGQTDMSSGAPVDIASNSLGGSALGDTMTVPITEGGIPEPTSGLLLLIGGSLLALRRKQK